MPRALSADTRHAIDNMLDRGHGPRAIAKALGLHRTTIQRQKRKRAAEKLFTYLPDDLRELATLAGAPLESAAKAHEFGRAKYGDFNWKPTPDANRPRAKAWSIANVIVNGIALGVLASALLAAYHNYIATP